MVKPSLSFKNLLFKKMPFNYSDYFALLLHFAFFNYKILLLIQKNQQNSKNLLNLLITLKLRNNYMLINASFAKLLFKIGYNSSFFFRELILIFFDNDALISGLLIGSAFINNIAFLCHSGFFLNAKFLNPIGSLVSLFSRNFSAFKTSAGFAFYCTASYVYFISNRITQ